MYSVYGSNPVTPTDTRFSATHPSHITSSFNSASGIVTFIFNPSFTASNQTNYLAVKYTSSSSGSTSTYCFKLVVTN